MTSLHYDERIRVATVGETRIAGVERTRLRSYPGLASSAPPTAALYEEALARFSGRSLVWDVGAGAGFGSGMLAEKCGHVVAIDPDPTARAFAHALVDKAEVCASLPKNGAPDAVIVVDVLGFVASPADLLRALRPHVNSEARVFVAEPRAFPGQVLRSPARRAFTLASLEALATAAGFEIDEVVVRDGTFIACTLRPVDDEGVAHLATGSSCMGRGDADGALAAFAKARQVGSVRCQREAALAEGELRYALQQGDEACAAFLAARELGAEDSRPLAALSQLLDEIGDHATATSFAQQAIKADPADVGAQVAMAQVLERGSSASALESWRRAVSLAPDQAGLSARYAMACLTSDDAPTALVALERTRSYGDAESVDFSVALARVYARLGRREDAEREIRIAMTRAPEETALSAILEEVLAR